MNVVMLSPGFPWEMVHFTRGLANVGARVIGLGEGPVEALPKLARESLADYIRVGSLWDEEGVIADVRRFARRHGIDQVECLWEPGMILAARLREALGLTGLTVEQTVPFRDKERMKQVLDDAGIRTPRHRRATSEAGCRAAAEELGFPLILKPIAGAGSADTYKVTDAGELDDALRRMGHVPDVSVEEFVDGEEFTFDTISVDGRIAYYNVAWYRPKPLIARSLEWVSPQTVTLRDPHVPALRHGLEMGQRVLDALGFRTGFSHMEWFRLPDGEAVFGEIGARPPGARSVELMNYGCDLDAFSGWAEAACHGRFSQPVERRYNSAVIFKRAQGQGRIRRIEGLERLVSRFRQHIVSIDLLPIGAMRRNWKQTLLSDGHVIVRHPDLQATLEIADRFGTDLQIYAG
jgi:hypothetical protein